MTGFTQQTLFARIAAVATFTPFQRKARRIFAVGQAPTVVNHFIRKIERGISRRASLTAEQY
jgi:hypothetical protein